MDLLCELLYMYVLYKELFVIQFFSHTVGFFPVELHGPAILNLG